MTSQLNTTWYTVPELSVKYPKLGALGPSFAKTVDEIKSQDERITHANQSKRKRTQEPVFSPTLVLTRVSTPVLDLP